MFWQSQSESRGINKKPNSSASININKPPKIIVGLWRTKQIKPEIYRVVHGYIGTITRWVYVSEEGKMRCADLDSSDKLRTLRLSDFAQCGTEDERRQRPCSVGDITPRRGGRGANDGRGSSLFAAFFLPDTRRQGRGKKVLVRRLAAKRGRVVTAQTAGRGLEGRVFCLTRTHGARGKNSVEGEKEYWRKRNRGGVFGGWERWWKKVAILSCFWATTHSSVWIGDNDASPPPAPLSTALNLSFSLLWPQPVLSGCQPPRTLYQLSTPVSE